MSSGMLAGGDDLDIHTRCEAVITFNYQKGVAFSSFRMMFSGCMDRRYLIILEFDYFERIMGLPGRYQDMGPQPSFVCIRCLFLLVLPFNFHDENEQQRCVHSYLFTR